MLTKAQLDWRKRMVMESIQEKPHHYHNPEHLHRRAYSKGDMRCTHCKKWLNPNIILEDIEMRFDKRGGRIHADEYCPVNSPYVARMVRCPKFHPTRSNRVNNVKRY